MPVNPEIPDTRVVVFKRKVQTAAFTHRSDLQVMWSGGAVGLISLLAGSPPPTAIAVGLAVILGAIIQRALSRRS